MSRSVLDQYRFHYTISESEEDQDPLAPTVHTAPAAKPPVDHTTKPTTVSKPKPTMNKELKSLEDLKPEPSANPVIWRAKSDQVCEPAILFLMKLNPEATIVSELW